MAVDTGETVVLSVSTFRDGMVVNNGLRVVGEKVVLLVKTSFVTVRENREGENVAEAVAEDRARENVRLQDMERSLLRAEALWDNEAADTVSRALRENKNSGGRSSMSKLPSEQIAPAPLTEEYGTETIRTAVASTDKNPAVNDETFNSGQVTFRRTESDVKKVGASSEEGTFNTFLTTAKLTDGKAVGRTHAWYSCARKPLTRTELVTSVLQALS
jgi:hypothetical protein